METAVEVVPAGAWPVQERRDRVVLDHDGRHRRRIRMTGEGGLDFLLDLAETVVLRDGDGLRLVSGGFVEVGAADEALIEITAPGQADLIRIAWHLGNRHLPAAIGPDRILIRADPVIADLLRGLGAVARPVLAPFDPEGGAYGARPIGSRHAHHHHD